MSHLEEALLDQSEWIIARARREARSLRGGVEADDIAQEVLQETLLRIRDGWFDRAPELSLEAQLRDCLNWAFLHVRTRTLRERERRGELRRFEGDESSDPLEQVPDDAPGPDEASGLVALVGLIRGVRSARRRLVVMVLGLPHMVTKQHIDEAVSERTGGGALARPASELWVAWQDLLRDPRRASSAEWKLAIIELLYSDRPMGEAGPKWVQARVNALDRQLSNARAELRSLRATAEAP